MSTRRVLHSALLSAPLVVAGMVFGASLAGPSHGPAASGAAAPDGAEIYERDCAECHGSNGLGTQYAPPLVGVGPAYVDYVVSTGRMPIADPDDDVDRGPSAYDRPTQVALAEFAGTLGGPGPQIPAVDVATADVARGGELYRLYCAACHQSVGTGGALVDRSAPSLRTADAVQVAEAIRVGPFEMPAFGSAALDDDELDDVTAYVVDVLHDPPDRGGLPIWHLGPVPEGAVAIIVGLGALALVARWIERRPVRHRTSAPERER